jgi:uroporphyrin-III C-methyltransferase
VCTLATLHKTVVRESLASPSVIVVGDVLKGLASVQSDAFTHHLQSVQS